MTCHTKWHSQGHDVYTMTNHKKVTLRKITAARCDSNDAISCEQV